MEFQETLITSFSPSTNHYNKAICDKLGRNRDSGKIENMFEILWPCCSEMWVSLKKEFPTAFGKEISALKGNENPKLLALKMCQVNNMQYSGDIFIHRLLF